MKLFRSHFVLGLFLSLAFVQLVSSRPDWDSEDSVDFSSEESPKDPADLKINQNHHEHHHDVKSPAAADDVMPRTVGEAEIVSNVNSNDNQLKSEVQPNAPLSSGTNVAGFNDSCISGRVCNPNKDLTCASSNNTCQCKNNFVYIPAKEGCLGIMGDGKVIPLSSTPCQYDRQCTYSSWGPFSKCSSQTGQCECRDNAILYENSCFENRTFGDGCFEDRQCKATLHSDAVCRPVLGSISNTHTCICGEGYIWDNLIKACLLVPTSEMALGSICRSDLQCRNSSLGQYSKCFQDTEKCTCNDSGKPGAENVVYYKYVCYQKKEINSTCTAHIECEASLVNSRCEEHPAYMMEKVCICPSGKTCEPRNKAMGIFTSEMSTTAVVIIALASTVLNRLTNAL